MLFPFHVSFSQVAALVHELGSPMAFGWCRSGITVLATAKLSAHTKQPENNSITSLEIPNTLGHGASFPQKQEKEARKQSLKSEEIMMAVQSRYGEAPHALRSISKHLLLLAWEQSLFNY